MSSIMKVDIQKFDGEISCNLWKMQMKSVLIQHGLYKVLKGPRVKPGRITDEQWAADQKKRRGSLTDEEFGLRWSLLGFVPNSFAGFGKK